MVCLVLPSIVLGVGISILSNFIVIVCAFLGPKRWWCPDGVASTRCTKPRYSPPHVTPTVEFWSKIKAQGQMRESNAAAERAKKEKDIKQRKIKDATWHKWHRWSKQFEKAKPGQWVIIKCGDGVKVQFICILVQLCLVDENVWIYIHINMLYVDVLCFNEICPAVC